MVRESVSARATAPPQAELLTPAELEVQPAEQEPAPALRTETIAAPALISDTALVDVAVTASPHQAAMQAVDLTTVLSQPLVIPSGLAPITEALVKMILLKAKQGALSEDKAFELLGGVRLL